MLKAFKDVSVLRRGDSEGNGMLVRLTTARGSPIHAIAVPQDWTSRTGPTWTYLFESEGLTLVDAGAVGSYAALKEGIQLCGFSLRDIQRIVITHGHSDHDGAAGQLAQEAGAELWVHDVYARLLPFDPREVQRRASSALQHEMQRVAAANMERDAAHWLREASGYRSRHQRYMEARRGFRVDHRIVEGEQVGNLSFIHAPGHSPDEICATFDGVVFTGDHVLPQITPHPTTKAAFTPEIAQCLAPEYRDEDQLFGLEAYLRSLKRVADLGGEVAVLPAHRLFSKGGFNFESTSRAKEIIQHHGQRLGRILRRVGTDGASLEDVTRGIFERRKLIGGNLYAALSEVVAHIELLQDTGDLGLADDMRLRWTGTEHYRDLLSELASP